MQTDTILRGDIRQIARTLPAGSVHCIVTSPPYYGLRDYGTAEWEGGREDCDHKVGRFEYPVNEKQSSNNGSAGHQARDICPKCGAIRKDAQIGLEASPQEYVDTLVGIFRELRRVLRDDGTVWLNLGDSYSNNDNGQRGQRDMSGGFGGREKGTRGKQGYAAASSGAERKTPPGLKPKDLMMIPARVALALQADGWWLRSDIIWAKPSPMPESVTDRPTKAHEYIFLLSKSPRYYYDQEAVREPSVDPVGSEARYKYEFTGRPEGATICPGDENGQRYAPQGKREFNPTRNRRTIWTVATQPYKPAHFATFPPDLIRPCILAGCPERCCSECGAPWVRVVEKKKASVTKPRPFSKNGNQDRNDTARIYEETESKTTGFRPTCNHYDHLYLQDFPKSRKARKRYQRDTSGDWWQRVRLRPGLDSWPSEPGIVFDPFMGSGTLGQVAIEVDPSRRWLGCELNQDYIDLAWDRIGEAIVTKVAGKDYYKTIREKPDSTLTYQQLGLIGGE